MCEHISTIRSPKIDTSFSVSTVATMPHSKKGRLSGSARKELNNKASAGAVDGAIYGKDDTVMFARVTKMLGMGHVTVMVPTKTGVKELTARIPNKFGKRGATPITSNTVVSIYVGKDFDPAQSIRPSEHFDITAILNDKQTYELFKREIIPEWMLKSPDEVTSGVVKNTVSGDGYEFDYSEPKEESKEAKETKEPTAVEREYMLKGAAVPARKYDTDMDKEEFNIDDI